MALSSPGQNEDLSDLSNSILLLIPIFGSTDTRAVTRPCGF